MKLPELKKTFKNKYVIRIIAGVLTLAVVGSSTCAYNVYAAKSTEMAAVNSTNNTEASAEAENAGAGLEDLLKDGVKIEQKDIGKEETVYLIADSAGEVNSTIVSNWLKNSEGSKTLEDVSCLKDISNVKGDETFTQSGEKLTWRTDGKDIFYQGTTTKKAPVTEKITYYLEGKKIAAKDLAGKSGKVKIRFDYTNNEKTTVKINGKDEEINVPFVALSGMILNDRFSNVEVTNGKVISDGNNNVVVGITMPGLKDSLQVKEEDFSEDISIPEYFEVSADVKDFSLDMTMTVATGSADLNLEQNMDLSDLDEKIDELSDATDQLLDGSGELADGMDTLKSSLYTFSDGMNTLKSGLSTYTQGASQVTDGISTLKNQSSTLISGVSTISSSTSALNNGIKKLDKALNTKMSDQEKAAAGGQASVQAVQEVVAQFADDSNPKSYNNLKNYAAETFYNTVAGQDTINAATASARDAAAAQIAGQADVIAAQAADAARGLVSGQISGNPEMAAQMGALRDAVVAAGIVSTAQSMGITDISLITNDAGIMAQITANADNTLAALQNSIVETSGAVASETARSVASQVAPEVAGTVAGSVVQSVAGQAKDAVGDSVASAAKTAAQTAAGAAASQAVVAGAETAKAQVASQIEAKDAKTGYSLVDGMDALEAGISQMSENMPALSTGIDSLYNGSQQLVSNNEALNSGAGQLLNGTGELTDGVKKLNEGSHQLAEGIVQFNEDGIEKLVNAYNGDVKSLVERIQAVMDAGSGYETFTGKSDKAAGSVKFIIRTDAVKAEEK